MRSPLGELPGVPMSPLAVAAPVLRMSGVSTWPSTLYSDIRHPGRLCGGSLFITRSLAFVRYKRAMQALDAFDTPTQQELDSKSDKTCIVCREELHAIPVEGTSPANNAEQPTPASPGSDPDTSNGPPKRLPCGHIFHRNCLRSWFERQLTCPTWCV